MHVAFVTPAYPPLPGGGERYVGSLATAVAAAGHHVSVVTSAATAETRFWDGKSAPVDGASESHNGVNVDRLPIRKFPGRRSGLMLWRKLMVMCSALPGDQTQLLLRAARAVPRVRGLDAALKALESVDVFHAFNVSWEGPMAAAHAYARQTRTPLVITPFAHLGAGDNDRVARNSTMDHQITMMRDAAAVMALTEIEREGLAAYGVPRDRITVIGGGIDPLPADMVASPYDRTDNPDVPRSFALFVGRLSFDKGAIHAAEAVLALRARGRDVSLLLIGAMHAEFERFYRSLNPAARAAVRPLGALSDRDKHALLSRARCLVLPSRSDSFGIVLLEAWSHGVPMVAARAGGIPGVVDDGENGLLVPFGDVTALADAIERLLVDDAYARALGEAGRAKVVRQYSWDAVAARVLAVYETLPAAGGGPG